MLFHPTLKRPRSKGYQCEVRHLPSRRSLRRLLQDRFRTPGEYLLQDRLSNTEKCPSKHRSTQSTRRCQWWSSPRSTDQDVDGQGDKQRDYLNFFELTLLVKVLFDNEIFRHVYSGIVCYGTNTSIYADCSPWQLCGSCRWASHQWSMFAVALSNQNTLDADCPQNMVNGMVPS